MIDLFTTAKPFRDRAALHQGNAFRSWRACESVGRITNFGAVSGDLASLEENGVEVVEDIETTDNGLPSIRAMFERAAEQSEAEFLMFTNADMIYTPAFFAQAERCCRMAGENFLLVGSRLDFDSESELRFASQKEFEAFAQSAESSGEIHPPAGSDYFLFPRKQYLENPLPDLWVGRGGWDLYMIHHAKELGFPAVDLTPAAYGYHQNHDYGERGPEGRPDYHEDPEASYNLKLLPKGIPWSEWTLEGCTHEWKGDELVERGPTEWQRKQMKQAARESQRTQRQQERWQKRQQQKRRRILRRALHAPMHAIRPLRKIFRRSRRAFRTWRRRAKKSSQRRTKANRNAMADAARQALLRSALSGKDLRVVVGAGGTEFDGWVSTDAEFHNLLRPGDWTRVIAGLKLDRVLAEHVWEHLTPEEGSTALAHIFAHLRPGGRVRIAVPDGNHADPDYIENVRPGGSGAGADDHKILYTRESLETAFRDVGFETEALEYWDEDGEFHRNDWDPTDGMIRRSFHFDPRNEGGKPVYTSLIVDGIKPENGTGQ